MIRHVTDYARLSYGWIEDNGRDECWLRLPTGRDSVLYTDKKPMPEDSRVQELIQAHYAVRREWSKAHAACGKLPDNVPGLGGPPFSASREVYNDWSERCDAHKDACKQTERRLWAEIKAAQIAVEDELAKLMPLPELYIFTRNGRHYAILNNDLWSCNHSLTENEWRILIAQKLERQRAKLAAALTPRLSPKREFIPESVRIAVWRRDEGQCVRCRSRERLEFDHINTGVPWGSSTARDVQLLCEPCNRSKSDSIA